MPDKIKNAYHSSKDIYDDVLDQKNFFSKLYTKLFWSGTDDRIVAERLLSWIPDDFTGSILDVPVGTAVFTERKWKKLNHAKITCLDYSEDMLAQARHRLGEEVQLAQGDVAHLPFKDGSFDIVLSMNGFHAFPDKERAFQEISRVLKPGGELIACFYIRGKSKITDLLVKMILSKKGWFTPPFQTEEEVRTELGKEYEDIELHTDGSIIYFRCRRNPSHFCDQPAELTFIPSPQAGSTSK